METKARKKIFNIIMIALIAIIVICGIMITGKIQGWFGGNDQSPLVNCGITGLVNIERSGVGYTLKEGVYLESGDIVESKTDSEAAFQMNRGNDLYINADSEVEFTACEEDRVEMNLKEGEVFLSVPDAPDSFKVRFGKSRADIDGAVFSISQQQGSSSLNVYEGKVELKAEDGNNYSISSGEQILFSNNDGRKTTVEKTAITATSLSNYIIDKLKNCKSSGLCFSTDKLDKVLAQREKDKKAAEKVLEEKAVAIEKSGGSTGATEAGTGSSSGSGEATAEESRVMTCTVSIRCGSILKHMGDLEEGKNRYVPSNGVILSTSAVEFVKGESAYDVTKRVCNAAGIQMEASYTAIYGSYYVEGINHLYEFDCGQRSGWLYKVNGWAPNYGCSEYTLKDGDSIVWDYTCTGK